MDYPWWTNGARDEFEHDNDYPTSYYDPNAFQTQYEYIFCNYCGDNHYNEQCPHFSTLDFVEDDFPKVQANLHDNSFNLSWNHEHSLSWDPNYSFPSYAPHCQISPYSLDESSSSQEKMSRIMDMLQLYLDNENEYRARDDEKWREQTLALENLAIKLGELTSQVESLRQKGVFMDTSNDSCVENVGSSGELIMESDDVLPIVCDAFVGDCELKVEGGENNVECLIEVSSLKPNSCYCEQEKIPTIFVQNPQSDFMTLTDKSQVDFIGVSKYFWANVENFETIELEPTMCHIVTCFLKSLLIERSCIVNEFPLPLKTCLLKRNEDKVILVFDTYD